MALPRNAFSASAPETAPRTQEAPAIAHGIGAPLPRLEDPRLLTGTGRFADDVNLPGQTWGYVLRSPVAHAVIKRIDASGALAVEGLVAVLTGDDYRADGL